jgi:alpha-L-fucosidase
MFNKMNFFLPVIGFVVSAVLLSACTSPAQQMEKDKAIAPSVESKELKEQRMQWWRDAKFGLFIHWGVYAVPAGVYKGERVNRVASWIMQYKHIPVAEYKEYAKQFNPVKYDPEQWVKLAKEAGMKYLVITAKHHDGFALFDSKVTDWDVVDASPYGKDLLTPLVESCRKNDIRIGFYYSHAVDYVHPGGEVQSLDFKPGGQWDPVQKTKDMDSYFHDLVVPQVKELLTNYGKIDILWWDGGGWYSVNRKRADMILAVTKDYPDLLMNNRLGGDYPCDWSTPEQYIPPTGLGYDWETCMTMNDTWGYRSWDENWKSTESLLRNLIDIVSKGGNYLLNIGPKADGTIPEASVERLKEIGVWMKTNSESIYGTTASPFENIPWGRCTKKDAGNGITRLYLHVFDWPKEGKLEVPRVLNDIEGACLLGDENKNKLKVTTLGDKLFIEVPAEAPDRICSVIRLDIKGNPVVMNPPLIEADAEVLFDKMEVLMKSDIPEVYVHYSLDGSIPTEQSPVSIKTAPVILTGNTTVKAALFKEGERVSEVRERTFTREAPQPAEKVMDLKQGLRYEYFEGVWSEVPDFKNQKSVEEGIVYFLDVSKGRRMELFGMSFTGFIKVPETGVYRFFASYNDGCNVTIGKQRVLQSRSGLVDSEIKRESTGKPIVLEEGLHPITVDYFQRIDHAVLELYWSGPGFTKQLVNAQELFHL